MKTLYLHHQYARCDINTASMAHVRDVNCVYRNKVISSATLSMSARNALSFSICVW